MGALSSAVPSWGLQVHLGCVRLSPACPCRCLHTCHLRPARHYPRLWIRPPSSGDRRDLNPPDHCAAWRTLLPHPTYITLPRCQLNRWLVIPSFRPGDVGVAFDRCDSLGAPDVHAMLALPVRAPVNASPAASQRPAHDSGRKWLVTPSFRRTSTGCPSPVSLAHHGGRVGLAVELTARGASTRDVQLAGGWKNAGTVARYAVRITSGGGAVSRFMRGPGGGRPED